jgi:hypothetical protein
VDVDTADRLQYDCYPRWFDSQGTVCVGNLDAATKAGTASAPYPSLPGTRHEAACDDFDDNACSNRAGLQSHRDSGRIHTEGAVHINL